MRRKTPCQRLLSYFLSLLQNFISFSSQFELCFFAGSSDGRKYERASKLASCEIVAPDWITDSIKAHQALSPKNFSPNRLVDSVESGYLHAIDSVLTGASLGKMTCVRIFHRMQFQPLTISTYCIFNCMRFRRPILIWLIDPN